MKTVIIGEKYGELLEKPLRKLNLDVLLIPDNPYINKNLSGHADLSCFYSGKLYMAPYLKNSEFAKKISRLAKEVEFISSIQGEKYPNDVQLNVFSNKNCFICNEITASEQIVEYLTNEGKYHIAVNQGYANCCCLAVGESGIITSDPGIYNAVLNSNLFDNPLFISSGFIDLPGFDCGFIGGSAINISDCLIAFTGSLEAHPDKNKILSYLDRHNVEYRFLTELPILDIGGGFVI